ncbi:DUF2971 domain-containing protein [Aquipseudomonas ullengensis]|uniref:DUF2971 domain-containing protein n=1 Tax=Aquipseudomonas ullengensis TaxID=2759166 RepID=A0A7W4LQJ8_9GAMM|nr:DUF2971 domain-containing protein [Pseudomonas ullengensis]MBB2497486.1 DUF2971 domain-containing protein [Pseudomonas ullengensis]
MEATLRRYTEIPYVIDLLQTRELTLVNPKAWDDRNDSFYIEQYARAAGVSSTYALCLAEAPETYHHWRVFSHGSGGACITFDKSKIIKYATKHHGVRAESVQYCTISDLRGEPPQTEELPFLKRYAYADEKEFRLFYGAKSKGEPIYRIPIPLSAIDRITLSPWLPRAVAIHVKSTLKSINGCSNLRISRSTLVENETWKEFAGNGI